MGAICKTIEIHGDYLQPLLHYGADQEKTKLHTDIEKILNYGANPDKTTLLMPESGKDSVLVTGILCTPESANLEFAATRERYREYNGVEMLPPFMYYDKRSKERRTVQKAPVTAIHLIQSFGEESLDPRVAHQIGIELCEKLGVQAVVDTHMNTHHVHNHIIINAYMPDGHHKFTMNQDRRLELRELSDQIQVEHGLSISFADPRTQQRNANRSQNYRKIKERNTGRSWKERMRSDILSARALSSTQEEFKENMKDYGYEIEREKNGCLLYWNKTHTKKIWDRTLGDRYIFNNLFDIRPEKEPDIIPSRKQRHKIISIARYDSNGRRRSHIELLVRKAIAIIQRIARAYRRLGLEHEYHPNTKFAMMENALAAIRKYDVQDTKSLSEMLNKTGAALSHTKAEVRHMEPQKNYYDALLPLIKHYNDARQAYDSVRIWARPHDLHIHEYSPSQIAETRAALSPTTKQQNARLASLMKKHPEYRIWNVKKAYANLASFEAQQIIDFLSGKSDEKPEVLITDTEFNRRWVSEKKYELQQPP